MSDPITALLVEDIAMMREALVGFLKPLNWTILEAETLAQAFELMKRIPPPDFIFLDLNLPDSRDVETLAAIDDLRRMNPRCVVIVLTGLMDQNLSRVSSMMGADIFRHKIDVARQDDLWGAIKTAIEKPNENRSDPPFERSLSVLEKINALICEV